MSPITNTLLLSLIAPFVIVLGAPSLDATSLKQNGAAAQKLNAQFASLKKTDSCNGSDMACVGGSFAQCVNGKWVTTECAVGLGCFALPLVNSVGTSITCDTQADAEARIANTGVSGGLIGSGSTISLATVDSDTDSNCTDDSGANIAGSNATDISAGIANVAPSPTGANSTSASTDTEGNAFSTTVLGGAAPSACDDAISTITVTATVTASESSTSSIDSNPQSAHLASGFTLPPAATSTSISNVSGLNATATSSSALASPTFLNSTDDDSGSTNFGNLTVTLSPASASALLSSLSGDGVSISTFGQSTATASAVSAVITSPALSVSGTPDAGATEVASSTGAISLSFFTTTPPATATASAATLAAVASPSASAASGYGGYGYRVRRMGRAF